MPRWAMFIILAESKKFPPQSIVFGSIKNVVKTVEYRKFREQQKISLGGGSAFLDTSFEAD